MEGNKNNFVLTFIYELSHSEIVCIVGFVYFVIYLLNYLKKLYLIKKNALRGKHVVITGGSSGIGRSVAIEAASRGANVTIIGRNKAKLITVKQEIVKINTQNAKEKTVLPQIVAYPLDVTSDYESIEKAFKEIEESNGPIEMLVNCAGTSICARFEDTSIKEFKEMMELNFFGIVQCTKAVVTGMKNRGSGYIVLTSSLAGVFGIYGYTAYSSSKYAIRGLAEALYMELKPYGVKVCLALPPDTDTPGFAEELKTKLHETKLICESGGLVSPDIVAKQMINDVIVGNFFSTVGFDGKISVILCAGMSPFVSTLDLVKQVTLMGITRLVAIFYLISFDGIINKCKKNRNNSKKSE